MSFGFGFGFPKRLTSGGGLSPRLYLDFVGTNSLPSTVTFSRGTNATLTDSNGRVAWAPHNLLTNSEDFEAAVWVKTNATIASNNAVAPDGTTTADTFTAAAANAAITQPWSSITAPYTFSVWMRRVSGSGTIEINGGASWSTATITSDWQRISVTQNVTAGVPSVGVRIVTSGDVIQVWGAQLNVANAPVNLLTWSEDFSNGIWAKNQANIAANTVLAPDGALTADTITATSTNGYVEQSFASVAGTTYSLSFFAKIGNVNTVSIVGVNQGVVIYVGQFNLQTGTATAVSGSPTVAITDAGNGWYRCSVSRLHTIGNANDVIRFVPGISGATVANNFAYIWGAQLNTGSVALPYVATTSSIYLPPAYNSTTPKNLLGFTQEPENAAWTKSNSYVQQNLLTWSQDFDNAAWTKSGAGTGFAPVVTANAAIAPDGSTSADLVVFNRGAGNTLADQSILTQASIATTISTNYAGSFYIKAATVSDIGKQLAFRHVGAAAYLVITLTADWQRISRTDAAVGTSSAFDIANRGTVTADNTVSAHLWGAQLVQGSTAGDYTQTTSAAAPTRYLNWDGTLTGRKLVEDTANNIHQAYVAYSFVVNGVYGWSLYAKAGERSWVWLNAQDGTDRRTWFNLANGTVGTNAAGNTANITSVGGGWYRCSINRTAAAASGYFAFGVTNADNTVITPGDGTSGIYVSDFQLSNSASVDPYVYNPQAAAASAAYYGPRFDYNPTTLAANGLLIEEQRTNLLTYSEQFDNAAWIKTNSSITANAAVAPDGASTADKLVEDTNNSIHAAYQGFASFVSGTSYTMSVYVKAAGRSWAIVEMNGAPLGTFAYFDLSNGTVGTTGGSPSATSIASVGNGWWRLTISKTAVASGSGSFYIYTATGNNVGSYTGDGTSGIFIWGAQLEAGSFATSYIPTVASQVTRNADSASMLGDNFYTWYNPNQGTLYAEYSRPFLDATRPSHYVNINDNTSNNAIIAYSNVSQQTQGDTLTSGASQGIVTSSVSVTANTTMKQAYAVKTNSLILSVNGTLSSEDTSASLPGVSQMNIGNRPAGDRTANSCFRRIGYYNTRLPDSTLQALTV